MRRPESNRSLKTRFAFSQSGHRINMPPTRARRRSGEIAEQQFHFDLLQMAVASLPGSRFGSSFFDAESTARYGGVSIVAVNSRTTCCRNTSDDEKMLSFQAAKNRGLRKHVPYGASPAIASFPASRV